MEIHFHIGSVRVNGIESSAAMNIGTNLLVGFGSQTKNVQGAGHINGDRGIMPTESTYLDDRDTFDAPHWEDGISYEFAVDPGWQD
jgi:hypothetical protein